MGSWSDAQAFLTMWALRFFASICVALVVLVGLDAVGAIIDQSADLGRNYQFSDMLVYIVTLIPSKLYDFMPFGCLIGCLVGLGIFAGQ